MSKKLIKFCVIVFVVCLLVSIGVVIYRYQIRKITDVESYLSKDYVKYNYGKDAEQFFDDYTSSEDYKNIAFYYCDAEKMISPYNTWTIFVLDIHYEENEFDSVNGKLISKINKKDPDSAMGGFLVYKIENEDALYKKILHLYFVMRNVVLSDICLFVTGNILTP